MTRHVTFATAGLALATLLAGPASAQTTIKAASIFEESQIESQALQHFADGIAARTDGALTVQTYFGTSLGGQQELNEMLSTDAIQLSVHGSAPSDAYLGLFLPYSIADDAHLQKVLESEVGQSWSSDLKDSAGLDMLAVTIRGDRNTMTTVPVAGVEDLEGLRLRAPNIPALIAAVEAMKAEPVIISINEVYTGLSTGAIEGLENTLGGMIGYRFYEVAKNVAMTRHALSPVFWLANGDWFDGLDADMQSIVMEEIDKAAAWENEQNAMMAGQWVSQLEEQGVTVSKVDTDVIRTNAAAFVDEAATEIWGAEAYQTIQSLR